MLLWGLGGTMFFSVLATVITIERAVKLLEPGFHGHGFRITVAELSQPNGLVRGVVDVSSLVGIVALCLFAGATATEYSQGTLRNLLVREPHRVRLLAGKFLALTLFVLIAVVLAIAVGVAYALPGEAIINSLWGSGDRWLPGQLLSALAHGGTSSASYGHALITLFAYAAVVAAGTLALFRVRDV